MFTLIFYFLCDSSNHQIDKSVKGPICSVVTTYISQADYPQSNRSFNSSMHGWPHQKAVRLHTESFLAVNKVKQWFYFKTKLWKNICVFYIMIIWPQQLLQKNLKYLDFCVLSCFYKIEVGGSSLRAVEIYIFNPTTLNNAPMSTNDNCEATAFLLVNKVAP